MALTALRLIRVKNVAPTAEGQPMEDFPLQTANPALAPATLPANSVIGTLTISDPPTQSEIQALRDECENLRDALSSTIDAFNAFKDRFTETGDIPLFEDV
jgi:hypothetical protein